MKIEPVKMLSDIQGKVGTIYIYGIIGQDEYWNDERKELAITDIAYLKKVKELEAAGCTRCETRLNSPGGIIKHGDGMIATVKNAKMEMHVYGDGVVASMAADLFLAFKKKNRHVNSNTKLMIHAPISGSYGNANEHRQAAVMLETFAEAAIAQMVADTGMKEEEVKALYYDGKDHWLSAKKMVEVGFVEKIDDYEVEAVIAEPEKMSYNDLVKFYEQPAKVEAGILGRLNKFLHKFSGANPLDNQIDDDMKTTDDIVKAIKDGTINKEELVAKLGAIAPAAAPVTPATEVVVQTAAPITPAAPPVAPAATVVTTPATEKSMAEIIKDAVTAATAPLAAKVAALEAAPGATPVAAELPTENEAFKGMTPEQIEAKKALDADNEMIGKLGPHTTFERY